jgi:hypothetical protein
MEAALAAKRNKSWGSSTEVRYHPPVRRHLSTLLSAMSLLVCVATGVLWLRSYRVQDRLQYTFPSDIWEVGAVRGKLFLMRMHAEPALWDIMGGFYHYQEPPGTYLDVVSPAIKPAGKFGFGYYQEKEWRQHKSTRFDLANWAVVAPYWLIALVGVPLPMVWICRRVRMDRTLLGGRCTVCGYDLRATPDRCPECGKVPAGKTEISN